MRQYTNTPLLFRWILALAILLATALQPSAHATSSPGKGPVNNPDIPSGPSSATPSKAELEAIAASPDRSKQDRARDAQRKSVQTLYFVGVNRGMTVLDLSADDGYTAELLARTVGKNGRVYGQVAPAAKGKPVSFTTLSERANNLGEGKIIPVLQKLEKIASPDLPEKLTPRATSNGFDLAMIMFNYHTLTPTGVDRKKMSKALFAALKPGSMLIVADHAAAVGRGITDSAKLHRVEEAFVRKELMAAGFVFIEASDLLRNPADPRDKDVPENGQAKDGFILKFVKP